MAKHKNVYSHILATRRTKNFFWRILGHEPHIASNLQHHAVPIKKYISISVIWPIIGVLKSDTLFLKPLIIPDGVRNILFIRLVAKSEFPNIFLFLAEQPESRTLESPSPTQLIRRLSVILFVRSLAPLLERLDE